MVFQLYLFGKKKSIYFSALRAYNADHEMKFKFFVLLTHKWTFFFMLWDSIFHIIFSLVFLVLVYLIYSFNSYSSARKPLTLLA